MIEPAEGKELVSRRTALGRVAAIAAAAALAAINATTTGTVETKKLPFKPKAALSPAEAHILKEYPPEYMMPGEIEIYKGVNWRSKPLISTDSNIPISEDYLFNVKDIAAVNGHEVNFGSVETGGFMCSISNGLIAQGSNPDATGNQYGNYLMLNITLRDGTEKIAYLSISQATYPYIKPIPVDNIANTPVPLNKDSNGQYQASVNGYIHHSTANGTSIPNSSSKLICIKMRNLIYLSFSL